MRHHIVFNSGNRMIPGLTAMSTTTDSCPRSCAFLDKGCHAQKGHSGIHRERHDNSEYDWYTFDELLVLMGRRFTRIHRTQVSGCLWAVDKDGEMADPIRLNKYIKTCLRYGLLPIVYTAKAIFGSRDVSTRIRMHNLQVIRAATSLAKSFAINLSLTDFSDVDKAMSLGLNAVCTLPNKVHRKKLTGKKVFHTPAGRRIITCPGKYGDKGINCTNCGGDRPLCTRKDRDYAIGFPASGGARSTLNIL